MASLKSTIAVIVLLAVGSTFAEVAPAEKAAPAPGEVPHVIHNDKPSHFQERTLQDAGKAAPKSAGKSLPEAAKASKKSLAEDEPSEKSLEPEHDARHGKALETGKSLASDAEGKSLEPETKGKTLAAHETHKAKTLATDEKKEEAAKGRIWLWADSLNVSTNGTNATSSPPAFPPWQAPPQQSAPPPPYIDSRAYPYEQSYSHPSYSSYSYERKPDYGYERKPDYGGDYGYKKPEYNSYGGDYGYKKPEYNSYGGDYGYKKPEYTIERSYGYEEKPSYSYGGDYGYKKPEYSYGGGYGYRKPEYSYGGDYGYKKPDYLAPYGRIGSNGAEAQQILADPVVPQLGGPRFLRGPPLPPPPPQGLNRPPFMGPPPKAGQFGPPPPLPPPPPPPPGRRSFEPNGPFPLGQHEPHVPLAAPAPRLLVVETIHQEKPRMYAYNGGSVYNPDPHQYCENTCIHKRKPNNWVRTEETITTYNKPTRGIWSDYQTPSTPFSGGGFWWASQREYEQSDTYRLRRL